MTARPTDTPWRAWIDPVPPPATATIYACDVGVVPANRLRNLDFRVRKNTSANIDDDLSDVWGTFPRQARQTVIDNDIRVFCLDGFKIAREEATDPELQFRMQGNAFQGAFFAASPLMERANLTEEMLAEIARLGARVAKARIGNRVALAAALVARQTGTLPQLAVEPRRGRQRARVDRRLRRHGQPAAAGRCANHGQLQLVHGRPRS